MAANGSYTYTSPTEFSGTDTFTYSITDGTTTRTATVTITVNPVADDDSNSTPFGATLVVNGPGVLANDHGTTLTVLSNTQPSHGTVTVNPDGGYRYVPTAGYSGSDSFTYTLRDAAGRQSTATVRLSVGLVAADDTYSTPADTRLTVAAPGVLANDNGTGLQVTGFTQPPHGTVSVAGDGSLVFVPEANWSGRETFDYSAQDSSHGTTSATVHLVVTPRAVGDTGSTVVGTALHVGGPGTAGNLLANDRGTSLTVTGNTAPDHGTVTVNPNGSYDFTPPAGYSGPASFTYTVTDADGGTNTALVLLTVTPTATDDSATTPVDTPVALTPVANDHGSSLAVTGVTQPAHGQASVVNGGIRFVPDRGWSGVTTCVYTATDASGQTVTATVTIKVTPVAAPDRARTGQGIPVTLDSVVNDRGSALQITDVVQPPAAQGSVTIRDGRLVFRPADGFVGTATFDYTVTDAAGQTTTATDTVVVSPVGDADPDEATTTENQPVTIDPTANDPGHATFVMSTLQLRDPKTGVLATTVTVKGQGTYVVDPRTGKVTFTPVKGFHGTADPITYQVLDSAGALHVSTIEVTVTKAAGGTSTATGGSGSGGSGSGGAGSGSDLPGTGSPIGWQVPVAGLMLLVAGLVLTLRRRREPAPVRVKGGSRRATPTNQRGTHRQG